MKKTKMLTLLAVLLAFIALTAVLSGCEKKTPAELFNSAFEKTAAARGDKELRELVTSALERGSVSLAYNSTDDLGAMGIPFDSAAIKLYGGKDKSVVGLNVGEDDMTIFAENGKLAVTSSLLGGTAYGVDTANIKEDYKKSIFADPDGAYSLTDTFGEDGETLEAVTDYFSSLARLGTIAGKYNELLVRTLDELSLVAVTDEEGGSAVTLSLDNASMRAVALKLDEDKELHDAFISFAEVLSNSLSTESTPDDSPEITVGEFFDDLDAEGTFKYTVTLHIDKKELIRSIDAEIKSDGEYYSADIAVGCDISDEKRSEITVRVNYDDKNAENEINMDMSQEAKVICEISEDTAGKFSGKMTVEYSGITYNVIEITLDRVSGEFELTAPFTASISPSGECIALSGNYKRDKAGMELKITSVTLPVSGDGTFQKTGVDLTLAVTASDPAPALPEYTDFFSLTEEQFSSLASTVTIALLPYIMTGEITPFAE